MRCSGLGGWRWANAAAGRSKADMAANGAIKRNDFTGFSPPSTVTRLWPAAPFAAMNLIRQCWLPERLPEAEAELPVPQSAVEPASASEQPVEAPKPKQRHLDL